MPTVAELMREHVTLSVESFDRLYLNGYVPTLQVAGQLVSFLTVHHGQRIPSPALLGRMTKSLVRAVESFVRQENIPLVQFERGKRKDDVANELRKKYPRRDGVIFVGAAQEKARAFKGRKATGRGPVSFDFSRQDVFVKHFYFYIDDEDFGPCFIKLCTYLPFAMRVCLNGHEWLKRQLDKRGIAYESLDNGFLSCEDPVALQRISDQLGPAQIEAFFRKWVERLPYPFSPSDRMAGYRHQLSVWQMEYSLTHVFTRPVRGREFFEQVIRENLDLGRPDRVQLLFKRKITKRTPGRFRTRVITSGVHPSIHVDYKSTRIKQYFKLNRALRTETTIQDAKDFGVGRRLKNLPHLKSIARNTNRRLLEVQKVSQDCVLSNESVQRLTQPTVAKDGQRAPGMRFGDPRVMALFAALTLFLHVPNGFRNRDLRIHLADLLAFTGSRYTAAKMSYDLRRMRLKGIIVRLHRTNRYFLTPYGRKATLFLTRLHARLLRPAFAAIDSTTVTPVPHRLRQALDTVDREIQTMIKAASLTKAS